MSNLLCCVVALPAEAKPLLAHWEMHRYSPSESFPVYKTRDDQRWLIISGIGKVAAASALGYLAHCAQVRRSTCWLNWGICGSAEYELGDVIIGHKVTDVSLNKNWYPSQLFQGPRLKLCPATLISTYDAPTVQYPSEGVVDMEAAAFCGAATRFSSVELIQSVKIVSDTPNHPLTKISKDRVNQLITSQLTTIDEIALELLVLGRQAAQSEFLPKFFDEFHAQWHFTVSQSNQLKRLLVRWSVLLPDDDVWQMVAALVSAKDVLLGLTARLGEVSVQFGEVTK